MAPQLTQLVPGFGRECLHSPRGLNIYQCFQVDYGDYDYEVFIIEMIVTRGA